MCVCVFERASKWMNVHTDVVAQNTLAQMAYKPNSIGNMLKSLRTFIFNAVCSITDQRVRLEREKESKSVLRYLDCAISEQDQLRKSINAQKSSKAKLQEARNVCTICSLSRQRRSYYLLYVSVVVDHHGGVDRLEA